MNKLKRNLTKKLTVVNELGLHARPAAKIAEIASTAASNVWLIKNGEKVDASSVIDILSLCCTKDTQLTLQVENKKDSTILEQIADLFERKFKEQ